MQLRTITIIAEWYSLLIGLLCIAADLYYILLNTCTVDYPGVPNGQMNGSLPDDDPISFFHNQYIMGESCLIEDLGTGNGTRYWYTCNDVNGLNVTTHYVGNKMTD